MPHKNNQQLLDEENKKRRRRKEASPKIKTKPPSKMFKEDWRIIFEILLVSLEHNIDENTLKRRVVLCKKILPKFLNPNAARYKKYELQLINKIQN